MRYALKIESFVKINTSILHIDVTGLVDHMQQCTQILERCLHRALLSLVGSSSQSPRTIIFLTFPLNKTQQITPDSVLVKQQCVKFLYT